MPDLPAINASIRLLLERCPQLQFRWEQERSDRMDIDTGSPSPYAQAAALAAVVVATYKSNAGECLPGLFAQLEVLLTTEGQADRELLVVGFIEDLQGEIGRAGLDGADFYKMLGPESRAAWDDLAKMWAEVQRKKTASELPGPFDSIEVPEVSDPKLRKMVRNVFRPTQ
ncbi:MAG TPA: hypothetical protein VF998_09075 [Candidatus Limnocylindria bacterium]